MTQIKITELQLMIEKQEIITSIAIIDEKRSYNMVSLLLMKNVEWQNAPNVEKK